MFLNLCGIGLEEVGIKVAGLPLLLFSIIGIILVFIKNHLDSKLIDLKEQPELKDKETTSLITKIKSDETAIDVLLAINTLSNDYKENSEMLGSPIRIPESKISKRSNASLSLTQLWIGKLKKADLLKEGFGEVYGVAQPGLELLRKEGRLK